MSCFICENDTFKAVTKICWLYGMRQERDTKYPLTLKEMDEFLKKVATVNAENYSIRYHEEEVEVEVELFSDFPPFEITPQDIKSTCCWMYQSCDYMDKSEIYLLVKDAIDWADSVTSFTKEEMKQAQWK